MQLNLSENYVFCWEIDSRILRIFSPYSDSFLSIDWRCERIREIDFVLK